jgi:hypothetical protein
MGTARINEVRDTFAPAQLATASLNFGVGRSRSLCIKSPIEARTPATQNFCQLLSFGCEFLKFESISCFVFLWDVYRVSPHPVACGALNLKCAAGEGEATARLPPPGPRLAIAKFWHCIHCLQLSIVSYKILHYPA